MQSMTGSIWIFVGLGIVGFFALAGMLARLYRKAGPHEALIVYGFRNTRIVKGHGTIIVPMFESFRGLSLELMSFDVAPQQDLYTKQGVAVTVEAVAQIKVKSDNESILTASEQFLTKSEDERNGLIRLVMEGHLRGIIGQLTVEEIVKQPEMVADRMRATCADDMTKMGLEVVSFTIKEVRDKNEYISNMGKPDVARIRRDADVATAEAERDTAITALLWATTLRLHGIRAGGPGHLARLAVTVSNPRRLRLFGAPAGGGGDVLCAMVAVENPLRRAATRPAGGHGPLGQIPLARILPPTYLLGRRHHRGGNAFRWPCGWVGASRTPRAASGRAGGVTADVGGLAVPILSAAE